MGYTDGEDGPRVKVSRSRTKERKDEVGPYDCRNVTTITDHEVIKNNEED